MKEENLIKSKNRVQKHGEVFTPSWMVEKMLDIPGIKEASESITATFFEPSAGDGNFLQAILERKLKTVTEKYSDKVWKTKSLFALLNPVLGIFGFKIFGVSGFPHAHHIISHFSFDEIETIKRRGDEIISYRLGDGIYVIKQKK